MPYLLKLQIIDQRAALQIDYYIYLSLYTSVK